MNSRYSNNKNTALFQKHQTYEVATSLTDSKFVANDLADTNRYQYRAHAVVVGDVLVKLYEAIYLDGLPNGMSGYWTVLGITHIFGGIPTNYMMELELGTDTLGEEYVGAKTSTKLRDIAGELAGQALRVADSSLKQYSFTPNQDPLPVDWFAVTNNTAPRATAVPETIIPENPYSVTPPNFSNVKRTTKWEAS